MPFLLSESRKDRPTCLHITIPGSNYGSLQTVPPLLPLQSHSLPVHRDVVCVLTPSSPLSKSPCRCTRSRSAHQANKHAQSGVQLLLGVPLLAFFLPSSPPAASKPTPHASHTSDPLRSHNRTSKHEKCDTVPGRHTTAFKQCHVSTPPLFLATHPWCNALEVQSSATLLILE